MEHAHPIARTASWRSAAAALVLVVVALVGLGAWALVHHLSPAGTSSRLTTGHVQKRQSRGVVLLRPRATTSVLVLNGNGISGAAGGVSSRLLAHGYRSVSAANAQVTTYTRSIVLFNPGWEREAKRLARDAHIGAVAALDGPLPAGATRAPLVAIVGN